MNHCGCFGFMKKHKRSLSEASSSPKKSDGGFQNSSERAEEILAARIQYGMACREVPVKETSLLMRSEDEDGNKMINEYVREHKIGAGKYGKVALYRSSVDGKQYAIKAFRKSQLLKIRVGPSETAMSDVLREISIMKVIDHPNIVSLIEVINDPDTDNLYMVLEYVEGKWVADGSGPSSGSGEITTKQHLRDIIAGLMYLHTHNIVHGDIKPDNLLVTSSGIVKIADFSVSQVVESNNDELRRAPGTPAFTAPECITGPTYHGKPADAWALGITLYRMSIGEYPFLEDTLRATLDKIVKDPIPLPNGLKSQDPDLRNLLVGILCKDPRYRLSLTTVSEHRWVVGEEGPIRPYPCWCMREQRTQRQA